MGYFLKMLSLVYCLNPSVYIAREVEYKEDCKIHGFSIKLCLRICICYITFLCLAEGKVTR